MLGRLRGEEENSAENLVSSPTQDAVEQLIGAQRLEKVEELDEKVLGQNLLGGEVLVEEELQEIVREAMRQVDGSKECTTLLMCHISRVLHSLLVRHQNGQSGRL